MIELIPERVAHTQREFIKNVKQYRIRKRIRTLESMGDIQFEAFIDSTTNRMIFELYHSYFGEKQGYIEVPSNWWQHFKERFAPKIYLKRYPVKYTKHNIVNILQYPPDVNGDRLNIEEYDPVETGYIEYE